MAIEVRPVSVTNKKDVEVFLHVPWSVGLDKEPNWVPPMLDDLRKLIDPKHSIFLPHGEFQLWTAFKDGAPAGRISAQVDFDYDKTWPQEPPTAFFGFFECIDDVEVAKALFAVAEEYARSKKRTRLRGPMTFDTKGDIGVLIDGFDTKAKIGTVWNRPFLGPLIEKAGYAKVKDLLGWRYDATVPMDEFTSKISKRTRELPNVVIRNMSLKHIERDAKILQDIYNEAWSQNWNFTPFTDGELAVIANDYKIFIDEQLAYVAEVDGKPAAVLFAIPDLNEIIGDFKGELMRNPINLAKFLWRLKFNRPKGIRLILLGVKNEYRASRKYGALVACLYEEISVKGKAAGYQTGELSWTLEDNDGINRGIERMGATLYKKWRMFERAL